MTKIMLYIKNDNKENIASIFEKNNIKWSGGNLVDLGGISYYDRYYYEKFIIDQQDLFYILEILEKKMKILYHTKKTN